MNVKEVGLDVRRLDLIRLSIVAQHGLPLRVKADIPLAELEHHRLRDGKVERDESGLLARVLCMVDILEPRSHYDRTLRLDQEVLAQRHAGLVLAVIDAGEHRGRDLSAVEGALILSNCHQITLARKPDGNGHSSRRR